MDLARHGGMCSSNTQEAEIGRSEFKVRPSNIGRSQRFHKKIIKRLELVKKEKDLWNITLLWTLGFDLNFLKFMLHKYSFIFLLNFLLHLYIQCVCTHVCRGIDMPWCACEGYSMIFFDVFFIYDVGSRVQTWL